MITRGEKKGSHQTQPSPRATTRGKADRNTAEGDIPVSTSLKHSTHAQGHRVTLTAARKTRTTPPTFSSIRPEGPEARALRGIRLGGQVDTSRARTTIIIANNLTLNHASFTTNEDARWTKAPTQGSSTHWSFLSYPIVGSIDCNGLIVVVGPNSSGKSQLLQDIYQRICGEPRALVVATNVLVRKPDEYDNFVEKLVSDGYFDVKEDENGQTQWVPKTISGQGSAISQIDQHQARGWHASFDPVPEPKIRRRNEFLNYFGRLLVTALFLERRLTAMSSVGTIDFENTPPQHELHALYLNDDARVRLYIELLETFGKAVWPDASRGNTLSLKVSDEGQLPSSDDRLSPKIMSRYRNIESEGDGLKSYVAICVSLLLGERPLCLIDEPEMCLHPPQAHNLGRFIGRQASGSKNLTVVSTHSSQILRGIIQTSSRVQIVRLTRKASEFHGHLVPSEILNEAVAKPTVRAESVLDGIFAQGVIVIEGDGDRLVYQSVWETMADEFHQDFHFAAVGGTGGIADTCNLYQTLKIPVAVIADLDVITDATKIEKILSIMADNFVAAPLIAEAKTIANMIRSAPPTLSPAELRATLNEIKFDGDEFWEEDEDIRVRRRLNQIAANIDRIRRLKQGGISALPSEISSRLGPLLSKLADLGVFLVPVGELEGWLANYDISVSRRQKWAWANAAAQKVQSVGRNAGDIWDFMQTVGVYLGKSKVSS